MESKGKVGIIGSGLVGRSWAMIFASAGYTVSLYDLEPSQVESALKDIVSQLEALEKSDSLRGQGSALEQARLIKGSNSLEETVTGACYVQECVPEVQTIKTDIFNRIGELLGEDSIAASSTSYMTPSLFTKDMPRGRERAIVAHPVNPPYYAPLVEIVPAPWTHPKVVEKVRNLMTEIGQAPVTLAKEKMGFSLNRIQTAIILECWKQVEEGLISVKDVDTVMWAGLGMRYAFLGPLEVAHLNAEGMRDYLRKFSTSMLNTAKDFAPIPEDSYKCDAPTGDDVCQQLENLTSIEDLAKRRAWRDRRVAALAKLKRQLDATE